MHRILATVLVIQGCSQASTLVNETKVSYDPHDIIQLTSDRRLALPLRSLVVLTTTLSLPMGEAINGGTISSATFSVPFTIDCDKLGMTSEENTWGKRKRDLQQPSVGSLAGGDREVMYKVVERSLNAVGINGKACMLRAICEMFVEPLDNHGFVGEMLEIFFSPSRRHKDDTRLSDYTKAELEGKSTKKCFQYHEDCPYSFFKSASVNETLN